jgi:hypothetical protein
MVWCEKPFPVYLLLGERQHFKLSEESQRSFLLLQSSQVDTRLQHQELNSGKHDVTVSALRWQGINARMGLQP